MNNSTTITAIHEAGHAVACLRLFEWRLSEYITIEADNESAGHHITEALDENEPREILDHDALYACAGYAALVAAGYPEHLAEQGCGSDFSRAEQASSQQLEVVKQQAVVMMQRSENIHAVAIIAEKLEEQRWLDGDHLRVMLDFADGEITETEYGQYLTLRGRSHS